ncbi:hypothetical protein CMI37_29325 [Candidatus Pacearchaeota archaeon]|jgi:hypothetical protein|nr:hypothetical protein [Candidatus Pacearchaeota archaeon]
MLLKNRCLTLEHPRSRSNPVRTPFAGGSKNVFLPRQNVPKRVFSPDGHRQLVAKLVLVDECPFSKNDVFFRFYDDKTIFRTGCERDVTKIYERFRKRRLK